MSEYEKMVALVCAHRGEPENVRNIKEAFDGLILARDLSEYLNSGAGVPEAIKEDSDAR